MNEPTFADVLRARERIASWAHWTPVLTSSSLDHLIGASVFFKAEPFQRTGSFKFRGATNAVLSLSVEERARGVVTHSSGNHAQALALAARLAGAHATIVMPEDALPAKRRATEGYGATVVPCAPTLAAREETATLLLQETGGTLIHPHDDPRVIAGQGTAAVELIEDRGPFDLLLAPVGGGGLLSGTAIAAATLLPKVRVVGCEPAGADDAYRSFRSGVRVTGHSPKTIADGLRTTLGEIDFQVIRRLVSDVVLVSEEEILEAMRLVWERLKVVIEPSAAVAVAPLLNGSLSARGRIGVILSGGNVDLDRFFPSL